MKDARFEERYRAGDTPWDHGMVDGNLIEIIALHGIRPCRALDVGCGTGENAIWLAGRGFEVTACDLSPTAIAIARGKTVGGVAAIRFLAADFLADPVPGTPFGFIFDRGCLHCMEKENERIAFVRKVESMLDPGGLWLTLAGNADEGEREIGPPQLTALELVSAVESRFEILSLSTGYFGSDQDNPPRAWICLVRKRADGITFN